ncbi:TetR/AcrR family transcriptional regulator [Kitasatospora sp. NPDC088134]|uniref:TetR/AcrR family transcriptional regulator n=1 Tax=Kitasatospora sp. NPDC088134 TaxID=3364071 RepID=UPI00382FDAD1
MSPRRVDPNLSAQLIEAAARLLSEEGPAALSTRKLAATVGTSTMAVYTRFGGMDDLVRAVVREGFTLLNRRLEAVEETDDPVADVVALGWAYRANAREHRHLYNVMFGGSSLSGFSLTDADRQHGRYTLDALVGAVKRCVAAERFQPAEPQLVAHQLWIALHGLVTLDLGGYLVDPLNADVCYQAQICGMLLGAGDTPERATASVASAARREV